MKGEREQIAYDRRMAEVLERRGHPDVAAQHRRVAAAIEEWIAEHGEGTPQAPLPQRREPALPRTGTIPAKLPKRGRRA